MEKDNQLTKTEKLIANFSRSKLGKIFLIFLSSGDASISNNGGIALLTAANIMCSSIITNIKIKQGLHFIQDWDRKKIDELFDENDEQQVGLVIYAFQKATECSRKSQINQITNILLGKLNGHINDYGEAEEFINVISELSLNEAIVLKNIYDYLSAKVDNDSPILSQIFNENDFPELFPSFPDDGIYYLSRLTGKGLFRENPRAKIYHASEKEYSLSRISAALFKSL